MLFAQGTQTVATPVARVDPAPHRRLPALGLRLWQPIWVCCLLLLTAAPAAGEPLEQATSLRFVPADVAFYATMLRNREQFDLLVGSKAFQAIRQLPIVQMGLGMARMQFNGAEQLAPVRALLEQPRNQELLRLLADAISHEVFVYGDDSCGDMLELAGRLNGINQTAQLEAGRRGLSAEEVILEKVLNQVSEYFEDNDVPVIVMGFKVTEPQKMAAQLARGETLLKQLLSRDPQWASRLSRAAIGGTPFVTLELDEALIPWDKIPLDELSAEAAAQLNVVRQRLREKSLVISVGIRDGYLIVSTGGSNEHLQEWGNGELLAERDEIKTLDRHASQRVVSVSYVSGSFLTRAKSANQQVQNMVNTLEQLLPLADLGADLEDELQQEAEKLVAAAAVTPPSGPLAHVELLTGTGYESYQYSWTTATAFDASRPLTILQHLGGTPLLAFAARGRQSAESYDQLIEFCDRAWYFAEKIAQEKLSDDEFETFEQVAEKLSPVFERLAQTTREKCLPGFEDGQGALIIEARAASRKWQLMLPPAAEPLPMLQPAAVYGVSDAQLVLEAAAEYYRAAQQILTTIHEIEPDEIPHIELANPVKQQVGLASLYTFALPAQWGVDQAVAPSAGLSEDTLVLSLFPSQAKRILIAQPLAAVGPLMNSDRPLAAAFYCNCAGFIDAIQPWVNYGLGLAGQNEGAIVDQVGTVMNVLKCLRSMESATYKQAGAMVTHTEVRIQDLP